MTTAEQGPSSTPTVIATTGISRLVVDSFKKQVLRFGASFSDSVNSTVTHLIARKLVGEKVEYAYAHGIPVVKQRWLKACFDAGKVLEIDAADQFLPLETLSISVTGSNGPTRESLEERITALGGEFCRKLNGEGRTTHLLALPPLERMDKFEAATEWGIPIVSLAWIEACEKMQSNLSPANFRVTETMATGEHQVDGPDKEETCRSSEDHRRTNSPPTIVDTSVHPKLSQTTLELVKRMNEERRSLKSFAPFLDGVRIHFAGFEDSPDCVTMLRVMLRGTSALNFSEFNTTVTHVVVPNESQRPRISAKELSRLQEWSMGSCRPHVVHLSWLLDCMRSSRRIVPNGQHLVSSVVSGDPAVGSMTVGTSSRNGSTSSLVAPIPIAAGRKRTFATRTSSSSSPRIDPMHPRRQNGKPLESLIVCVTGYSGAKRQQINKLSKALGATFTDVLNHHCTHLVCLNAAGDKYAKAVKWGHVQIVSMAWLLACSEQNDRVDESTFVVSPPVPPLIGRKRIGRKATSTS